MKNNPWKYDNNNATLTHESGYQVDLERCSTVGEVLDWVMQIGSKVEDSLDVWMFINALNDAARQAHGYEIQSLLCPNGKSTRIKLSWLTPY